LYIRGYFKKGEYKMSLTIGKLSGLLALAKESKLIEKTGTRISAVVADNYLAKIVLFGKNHAQANKLGLSRTIREYLSDGTERLTAEFRVKSSLKGGWGGTRTLMGTPKQVANTFKYLHRTVNENCNTITALENLEKLIPIVGNEPFARSVPGLI
jgi:hypothetical protein